ncbi:uncharacterized protein LOC125240558 [Leguminivora glycinivorella]|uniref:uncharacterized protein LOC125240558 n=1 Tax=Leguminivora glycinivorella TaxID=1035111 RepID=UPI00200C1D95|nr:uncharacterized protein LOC125240558 [Leguminivora glycinivorella]
MYKTVLFFVVAAMMVENIHSCCCCSREPYMTQACLECLYDLCPRFVPPKCGCDCIKDLANPCRSCGCGCGCGKSLYFPEVEYPVTSFNMNPFYFGTCFGF